MTRPAVYQLLPDRLKPAVFHRFHNPSSSRWHHVFAAAPLKYAPGVTMELCPSDVAHGCIAFTGFVELQLTRRIVERATFGGLMVDVGANAGYFSLLWTAANPSNQAIAFEPSRRSVELLERNIGKNHLDRQVEVRAVAAGSITGKVDFDPGPPEQTGWGGLSRSRNSDSMLVDCVRIDEAVDKSSVIDLMKIDVEGAEALVLMGCERLLCQRRIREIYFEQNKPRARGLNILDSEPLSFLASVGYRLSPRSDPQGELVEWQAVPQ